MPPEPIRSDSAGIDLHHRFQQYNVVDASPTDGTETVIATLALADYGDIAIVSGIQLTGWAAFTVGTNGVSANLRIRQTDINGTVIAATGATSASAAQLLAREAHGFDALPVVSTYVLTFTVGSASAASTVSALQLSAILI